MSLSGKTYTILSYPIDDKVFKREDYNFKRTENWLKANVVLDDIIKDRKRNK